MDDSLVMYIKLVSQMNSFRFVSENPNENYNQVVLSSLMTNENKTGQILGQ